jgi:biopolymer transport protein ExbD
MIAYLFYSSISLALLLVVYRFLLEKETRFTFNRVFLLWSLVFSFIIPLTPVGLVSLEIPWSALFSSGETVSVTNYQNTEGLILNSEVQPTAMENGSASISSDTLFTIAFLFYVSIAVLLFIKLIRIINRIQSTIRQNPKRIIQGCEVVFLNENVIPHTFINTVFLNKKQFERGEIPEEVFNHEFTHIKQKHSLDILFIEFLKIIFWFNPLLYLYKHAIALNHEYLADEVVLSKGTVVKNYQRLLLKTMEGSTIHGLSSSFNFSLTKRRLQMMNQSKTKVRFLIKLAMLAPLFAGLSLILGCEPASNENSHDINLADEMSIEIMADNALLVDQKRMTLDELESLLSELPESPGLVRMKVSPDAEFGVVTNVQSILKKYEAFIINYSSTKNSDLFTEEERAKIDEASKAHQQEYQAYMNLDPETTSLEELKSAYKKVKEAADEINRVFKEITGDGEIPPPIKLGPKPENRKLMSSEEAQKFKPEMEEALQELRLKTRAYMNIDPTESNSQKLEASYNGVMESLKNFGDAQSAYYNSVGKQTPPLPPIPPNPQAIIENQ